MSKEDISLAKKKKKNVILFFVWEYIFFVWNVQSFAFIQSSALPTFLAQIWFDGSCHIKAKRISDTQASYQKTGANF